MKYLTVLLIAVSAAPAFARDSDRFGYVDSVTQRYIEQLHSAGSPTARAAAARNLATRCNAASKDALQGALNDRSTTVQSAAKYALERQQRSCR